MPLALSQLPLIAAGSMISLAGLWLLARRRFSRKPEPLHITSSGDNKWLSEPTRLTCGLILLILGYHLIIWAFPAYLTAVQLKRELWYVWILIGMIAIAGSILMDTVDRKNDGAGGDTLP